MTRQVVDFRITKNAAQCPDCQTVLVSTHRHDFVACKCGNFVDGGLDYLRRGGPALDRLIDLSTSEPYQRDAYSWESGET